MELYEFNTELVTKMFVDKVAEIPEIGVNGALLANPYKEAKFPACVIQPPLQQSKYDGAVANLSITVEVWAKDQYAAIRLLDKVRIKLKELNLKLTNNTALFQDPVTSKWRFGGYFEVRWNAINNSFERN